MLPRRNAKIRFLGHVLDLSTRDVKTRGGGNEHLTAYELEILLDLLDAKGKVVARTDFTPWRGKNINEERHPADIHISALKAKLGKNVIRSIAGIGYALSPGVTAEIVLDATRSKAEVLDEVATKLIDTHAGPDLLATIKICDDRIKMGNADAETYLKKARACLNAGHEGFCLKPWREAVEEAKGAIAEALARDERAAAAYALRGLVAFLHDYRWKTAEDDLLRALDLGPHDPLAHSFYAHLLVARRDFDTGLQHMRTAVELAPADRITVSSEPWMLLLAGRHEDSISKGIGVVGLFPTFPPAHVFLGWAYQASGDIDRAIEEYKKALGREFLPAALSSLGNAYAAIKDYKAAFRALNQLEEAKAEHLIAEVSAYNEAFVFAGFGQKKKQKCIDALERAYKQRSSWLVYLHVDPHWDFLRQEKRFINFVQKLGLWSWALKA
ncbi:MAG TPA: hypothetical protein VGT24_13665 [Candidatus Acidoferrales bacterium]|nr:hypothetical protein [Candidatus Acidoferrales bacterium]